MARARALVVDAHGPPRPQTGVAALDLGTTASREGRGPVFAAVAAWQEWNPGKPWRLSKRGELLIERYCAQLDKLAGREGYGQGWLVGQIEEAFEPYVSGGHVLGRLPWDRGAPPGGGAPRSLGYFVRLLRRHARLSRKRARRA
jgi:hypothetical protein